MQSGLWDWYQSHSEFLYTAIVRSGWFYFDYWSLVHTWSGIVVITLLASLKFRYRWFWLVFFLTAYELLEVLFVLFTLHIFKPEHLNDQVLDILVGVSAAGIWSIFIKSRWVNRGNIAGKLILMAFSAATFAFLTAGFACQHTEGVIQKMDNGILGMLTLAGTLFLWAVESPLCGRLHGALRQALPWMVYMIVFQIILHPLAPAFMKPGWLAGSLILPALHVIFYRWFQRQTKRARLFFDSQPNLQVMK